MSSPIEKKFDRLFVKFMREQEMGRLKALSPYAWIRAWTIFLAKEMEIMLKVE